MAGWPTTPRATSKRGLPRTRCGAKTVRACAGSGTPCARPCRTRSSGRSQTTSSPVCARESRTSRRPRCAAAGVAGWRFRMPPRRCLSQRSPCIGCWGIGTMPRATMPPPTSRLPMGPRSPAGLCWTKPVHATRRCARPTTRHRRRQAPGTDPPLVRTRPVSPPGKDASAPPGPKKRRPRPAWGCATQPRHRARSPRPSPTRKMPSKPNPSSDVSSPAGPCLRTCGSRAIIRRHRLPRPRRRAGGPAPRRRPSVPSPKFGPSPNWCCPCAPGTCAARTPSSASCFVWPMPPKSSTAWPWAAPPRRLASPSRAARQANRRWRVVCARSS